MSVRTDNGAFRITGVNEDARTQIAVVNAASGAAIPLPSIPRPVPIMEWTCTQPLIGKVSMALSNALSGSSKSKLVTSFQGRRLKSCVPEFTRGLSRKTLPISHHEQRRSANLLPKHINKADVMTSGA